MNETGQRKILDKRFTILIASQALLALLILCVMVLTLNHFPAPPETEDLRKVASELHASGLISEALNLYEKYLDNPSIPRSERAAVSFSIAELYEQEGKPEKALSWFYRVKISDPSSEHTAESSKRIVTLLEKLGKVSAAKTALQTSTSLENVPVSEGSVVVAQIGEKSLYLHQLNEAIDVLPKELQKSFLTPQGKKDFLKKFAAEELLFDKALRLNLKSDPEIRKQMGLIEKQILINRLLDDEIYKKISVEEQDLQNFFKANEQNYVQEERAEVSLIKVKTKEKAFDIILNLKKGGDFGKLAAELSLDEDTKTIQGRLAGSVFKDLPFGAYTKETASAIFRTQPGKWTEPLLSQGTYSIFLVRKKEPEKKPRFEEIRKNVEMDYRMAKGKNLYQKLVETTLQGENVKFFEDRVK